MNLKNNVKVLYILGSGHSGSTLIDILLGRHPNITGLGECERIASSIRLGLLCGCGSKIEKCIFWKDWCNNNSNFIDLGIRTVGSKKIKLFKKIRSYFFMKFDNKILGPEFSNTYIEEALSVYNYSSQKQDTSFVVDSSKNIDRVRLISDRTSIRPVVLHVVRDVRGVAYSSLKKNRNVINSIHRWVIRNVKVEFLCRKISATHIIVSYEKFASNPEAELKRILESIGLEYSESLMNDNNIIQHQPAGNRIRFRAVKEIKIDNAWKKSLPILAKMYAVLIGWPLLVRYKYLSR